MVNNKILFSFLLILIFFQCCTKSENQELNSIVKQIQPSVLAIYTFDKNEKPIGQGSGLLLLRVRLGSKRSSCIF